MSYRAQKVDEQIKRIQAKIDMLYDTYQSNPDLVSYIAVETEKHKKEMSKTFISTEQISSEITNRTYEFIRNIRSPNCSYQMVEILRSKLDLLQNHCYFRYIGVLSYTSLSSLFLFLLYKRYMYGNKLLYAISFMAAYLVPTTIITKVVMKQNETDKI